jgi:copper chaperone NosL
MVVGDKRYAAQVVSDGERRFFDDLGCMVLWMETHKTERAWAHDAQGGSWVDAKLARYAAGARTPMGFGVEAHAGAPMEFGEMHDRVVAQSRKQP